MAFSSVFTGMSSSYTQGAILCCGFGFLWKSLMVMMMLSMGLLIEWSSLPYPNSLGRWIGEPIKSAILHTDSFLTNARGYLCLSKRHQNLLSSFFYYSVQIVLSGKAVHKVAASGATQPNAQQAQRHELRSYLEPLPEQERFEPLMDNLEAQTYETFEKDGVKYIQYQRVVSKALLDRISDENASTTTVVLMVVGAGRGPLVRASLQVHNYTVWPNSPSQSRLLRKLNKQEERMCKVRDLSTIIMSDEIVDHNAAKTETVMEPKTVEKSDRGLFDIFRKKEEGTKTGDEQHVQKDESEKKSFIEKIKEKLPGEHKKAEEVHVAHVPKPAVVEHADEGEHKEKKSIFEKLKEKIPGHHSKSEEENKGTNKGGPIVT
ncbi:hypothetical protein LXL04_022259 [Taraxacum kok-saghyz]